MPFALEGSTGTAIRDIDGLSFEVVDQSGESLFESPPSLMWDSAADTVEQSEAVRAEFPLAGDRTVVMPVEVISEAESAATILVSPDEALLSADDTVWPVRIDPTLGTRNPTEWIAVRTGGYNTPIYKWSDNSGRVGESMGYCQASWSPYCVTTFTSRLVWEFGGSGSDSLKNWFETLEPSDITSASFSADPGQRGSCSSTRTDVYRTSPITSSQQSWSSMNFVSDVRIMDPVLTGKYPYPNGYMSYLNSNRQAINPLTGQTVAKSSPWWHWAFE